MPVRWQSHLFHSWLPAALPGQPLLRQMHFVFLQGFSACSCNGECTLSQAPCCFWVERLQYDAHRRKLWVSFLLELNQQQFTGQWSILNAVSTGQTAVQYQAQSNQMSVRCLSGFHMRFEAFSAASRINVSHDNLNVHENCMQVKQHSMLSVHTHSIFHAII